MNRKLAGLFMGSCLMAGVAVAGPARAAEPAGALNYPAVAAPLAPMSAPHLLNAYYMLVRDFGLQRRVALTEEQKARVESLLDDNVKAQIDSGSRLQILQIELRQLLEAETLDLKAVEKMIDSINGVQASMLKSEIRTYAAIRDVLTPEQNASVDALPRF